jgi:hypothetical protein
MRNIFLDRRFQIYLKAFNLCASVLNNDYVLAQTCQHDLFSPIQAWQWINNRQLRHEYTGRCLDIVNGIAIRNRLRVRTCNSTSKSQQWACDGLFFEVIKFDFNSRAKISHLVASLLLTSRQQVVFALLVPNCQQSDYEDWTRFQVGAIWSSPRQSRELCHNARTWYPIQSELEDLKWHFIRINHYLK